MSTNSEISGPITETQACVVYDTRTGTVVHTHTFVPAEPGGRMAPDALVDAALEAAAGRADREYLAAKEVPPEAFEPGSDYRMDPETGAVRSERPAAVSPADRKARRESSGDSG
ncbi:hypothetical protein ACFVFI_04690 [Streptomyces sp. NPDC057705]|uniref:hypothetical protein n=1 Tax=Streptomyces sp. NPDC057705 TaxID=3346222 RepID=UPI0036AD404F